jgi:hypothetical protein
VTALFALQWAPCAGAASVAWVGASGEWSTATNWSSNPSLPGAADDVTIDVPGTQTITVGTGYKSVRSVTMAGDETVSLNSGSGLTVSQASTFSNLSMASGSGFNGGINSTITGNAVLQGGSTSGGLSGTINTQGTTTLIGGSGLTTALRVANGSVLRNNGTGVLTWSSPSTSYVNLDDSPAAGGGTFANLGQMIIGGTGLKFIENFYAGGSFNNAGTVDIQGGSLLLHSNGSHTGNFTVASGAVLQFGSSSFGPSNTLTNAPTGTGKVNVYGGTVTANGGIGTSTLEIGNQATLNLNAASTVNNFVQSGLSTLSGTGNLTVSGTASLAGRMTGPASTILQGASAISSSALELDAGRTLRNASTGTVTFSTSVPIELDATVAAGGGTLVNEGLFIATPSFDTSIRNTNGGGAFTNSGTLRKSGTATLTISAPFTNSGVTEVQAGKLVIAGNSSSHSGGFDVDGGASLEFTGGTHTLATAATGAGTVAVTSGTTLAVQGNFANQSVLAGDGILDPLAASGLVNAGIIDSGLNGVGALTVAGDLTQTSAGRLRYQIASLASYDTINVLGNLALAGVLEIQSLGGYNPLDGDSFTLMTFDDGVADASDLTGLFESILYSNFEPLVTFDVSYLDHSIVLNAHVASVPVPSALWMLGSALGLLAGVRRARKLA